MRYAFYQLTLCTSSSQTSLRRPLPKLLGTLRCASWRVRSQGALKRSVSQMRMETCNVSSGSTACWRQHRCLLFSTALHFCCCDWTPLQHSCHTGSCNRQTSSSTNLKPHTALALHALGIMQVGWRRCRGALAGFTCTAQLGDSAAVSHGQPTGSWKRNQQQLA